MLMRSWDEVVVTGSIIASSWSESRGDRKHKMVMCLFFWLVWRESFCEYAIQSLSEGGDRVKAKRAICAV